MGSNEILPFYALCQPHLQDVWWFSNDKKYIIKGNVYNIEGNKRTYSQFAFGVFSFTYSDTKRANEVRKQKDNQGSMWVLKRNQQEEEEGEKEEEKGEEEIKP